MRPITVLAPFTGRQRLLGLGGGVFVVAGRGGGSHIFALSNKLFRRCSARDMLLIRRFAA